MYKYKKVVTEEFGSIEDRDGKEEEFPNKTLKQNILLY